MLKHVEEMDFGSVEVVEDSDWRASKMGYKFNYCDDIWQLDGSITVNLGRARKLDSATSEGLRKTLCRYAEELSAGTVCSVFSKFNMHCDQTGAQSINVRDLTKWRVSLTDETECHLGALKSFLMAWNEWGYPGVDDEVVSYLEELVLKGMVKGKAVKSGCPYSGPLTSNELGALIDWASNAFSVDDIGLKQYAFFMSLVFTGRRSVQIRSLRGGDLYCRDDAAGHDYVLKIPRAKQRGVGFRKAFRSLSINEDLYLILQSQSESSRDRVERAIGTKLPEELRRKIPIFVEEDRIDGLRDVGHLIACLDQRPDFLHMTQKSSLEVVRAVSLKNMARSERTGEFINFTSRRFRYTKGTNLAKRGITGVVLAAALDHTDTQNIDVYTANTEEMAEQIDAVMAPLLAPLAQAFVGKLIDSERDALRADDPHSRVKNKMSQAIGNCGTHAFCASGYRACYTCVSFQAWRDAPHEEVLEEILHERSRQKERGVSLNVIQSTDRLLLAVQQVILLCKKAKLAEEMEENLG